jgi:hypothetical protein
VWVHICLLCKVNLIVWQRLLIFTEQKRIVLMATMNISLPDAMKDWVESHGGDKYRP